MFSGTTVKCIGTYADGCESWRAEVMRGDEVVAVLSGFGSQADATRAAEYVFAGAKRDWNLLAPISKDAIAAGAQAFRDAEKRPELRVMSRSTLRRRLVEIVYQAIRSAQTAVDAKSIEHA